MNKHTKNVLGFLGLSYLSMSLAPVAQAATFDISGNARFGTHMFSNLDLDKGATLGAGSTTSYMDYRLLLRPDVVVDDRFTLKSEMILLSNNGQNDVNNSPEGGGTVLGSDRSQLNGTQLMYVRRAWLDWASDWGIFRVGRQPKSWGLGLLYNAGDDAFDDYGTTVDRVGFEALVGSLNLNFGYEKQAENKINTDSDDADAYELSVQYANPEDLFNVGLLYTRNIRSSGSLTGQNSSHDLSIFTQKKWGNYQLGAEFVSITEAKKDGVYGVLAQADYTPGDFALGVDAAYASASQTNHFTFHPNYRPFLILFNQSLSAQRTNGSVRGGKNGESAVGGDQGTNGGGGGAVVTKVHMAYGFSNRTYTLGTELGYAKLIEKGNALSNNLGVEWDLHLTQKWYDNFKTVYAGGVLFPGKAFGSNPQAAWGVQVRGALDF